MYKASQVSEAVFFGKPQYLCNKYPPTENLSSQEDVKKFIESEKDKVSRALSSYDLKVRKAILEDIGAIKNLLDKVYSAEFRHYREYSLYETIRYGGTSIIMEQEDGSFAGVSLSAGYNDGEQTLFTSFTVVLPAFNGHNFGVSLSLYVSLLGLENGLKVKRCTANPRNIPTLINLLNYVGYVVDGFHKDLYVEGLHQFSLSLPLSPSGLFNNAVDMEKVLNFIRKGEIHKDYELVDCSDLNAIETIYQTTSFKIVAILPTKITGKPHQFFAIPL